MLGDTGGEENESAGVPGGEVLHGAVKEGEPALGEVGGEKERVPRERVWPRRMGDARLVVLTDRLYPGVGVTQGEGSSGRGGSSSCVGRALSLAESALPMEGMRDARRDGVYAAVECVRDLEGVDWGVGLGIAGSACAYVSIYACRRADEANLFTCRPSEDASSVHLFDQELQCPLALLVLKSRLLL